MRILTLDDMETRADRFRRWFIGHEHIHVYTSKDAIRELGGPRFDLVMLDHDLAEEHYLTLSEGLSEGPRMRICECASQDSLVIIPDPSCRECGGRGEVREWDDYAPGTGMDVVDFIIKQARSGAPNLPDRIIVHSFNTPRAIEMRSRLKDTGIPTYRVPFGQNPLG